MTLGLAYTIDENGDPAPWNESHWVDEDFNALIQKASGLVDVEARREVMCEIEEAQMERGTAMIAYFCNVWRITAPYIEDMETSPFKYDHFDAAWINPEKQA